MPFFGPAGRSERIRCIYGWKKANLIRRIMLVLIPSVVAFVLVASIVSGSARRGLEESTRDASSRMAAIGRVAQALRDADDPFETLPGYAKGGRASMTLRFVASDWDRSAGNDLLGILDRQGRAGWFGRCAWSIVR